MTTDLQEQAATPPDENKIIAERRAKLAAIREQGIAFPNDFKPEHKAADLHVQYGEKSREELEADPVTVVLAGRMMLKREAGKKAAFATLQDASGRGLRRIRQRHRRGARLQRARYRGAVRLRALRRHCGHQLIITST